MRSSRSFRKPPPVHTTVRKTIRDGESPEKDLQPRIGWSGGRRKKRGEKNLGQPVRFRVFQARNRCLGEEQGREEERRHQHHTSQQPHTQSFRRELKRIEYDTTFPRQSTPPRRLSTQRHTHRERLTRIFSTPAPENLAHTK